MIEVYINGNKTDVQLENEKTVGDILTSFAQTCDDNKAAVIDIYVDNKKITADIFDSESQKLLGDSTRFDFTVITVNEVKYSFNHLSQLFNELADNMAQVPVSLQNGKNSEVSNIITNLADSIDDFCHIAALASLFPEDFSEIKINEMNFHQFLADLDPILKDFEEGLQNNDTVLIGDLSEYEICPRLKSVSEALSKL